MLFGGPVWSKLVAVLSLSLRIVAMSLLHRALQGVWRKKSSSVIFGVWPQSFWLGVPAL